MKDHDHGHDNQSELLKRFVHAIETLAMRSDECLATKKDLLEMEMRIMGTFQEFATRVDTAFTELHADVDAHTVTLGKIAADVAFLAAEIVKLQNNPGTFSSADQASADALEARIAMLKTNLAAAKTSAEALDAATAEPPAPPTP